MCEVSSCDVYLLFVPALGQQMTFSNRANSGMFTLILSADFC